ncbi:MAG: hypothetical protein GC192_22500 [Bacteroidetes bacterium]|nr:hypothetical protein [Bacteroidota bacterium]
MSDFTALLEKYLAVLQLEKEEITQRKLLLRSYAERPNCYEFFEKKTWELDAELEALPYRDEVYFRDKQQLNLMYFGHPDTDKREDKNNTLKLAIDYFDAYCGFSKIKLKCASNAKFDTNIPAKVGQDSIDILNQNPVFNLYYRLEEFQRKQESSALGGLVDLYVQNIDLLRESEREYILKALLNYCTQQTNSGTKDTIRLSINLYKIGLQYNCLMPFGKLTKNTFQNIVTLGVICEEHDWVKNFMETYSSYLDDNIRVDAVNMSMAQWHFGKKEFDKTVQILQHNFNDQMDVFKAKSFIIRSWYELYVERGDCFDVLMSQLDAFEKFTRRDKMQNPRMKEALLKFISYTKKLVNRHWDDKLVAELGDEISKEPNIALKQWLLEKTAKGNMS